MHAEVAYNAFAGGCDLVKDDENLTDQKFNGFEKRAELTLKVAEKAEAETGERKMYLCNITAPTCKEMVRRLHVLKDLGASYGHDRHRAHGLDSPPDPPGSSRR